MPLSCLSCLGSTGWSDGWLSERLDWMRARMDLDLIAPGSRKKGLLEQIGWYSYHIVYLYYYTSHHSPNSHSPLTTHHTAPAHLLCAPFVTLSPAVLPSHNISLPFLPSQPPLFLSCRLPSCRPALNSNSLRLQTSSASPACLPPTAGDLFRGHPMTPETGLTHKHNRTSTTVVSSLLPPSAPTRT